MLSVHAQLNSLIKDESHDVLLMHLIKKYHGLQSVLNLLNEQHREPIKCLKSIKKKLEVCIP